VVGGAYSAIGNLETPAPSLLLHGFLLHMVVSMANQIATGIEIARAMTRLAAHPTINSEEAIAIATTNKIAKIA
jgi:hypothetical protein